MAAKTEPIDALNDLDLSGLLAETTTSEADSNGCAWTQANESRRPMAEVLGVPVATFTTRQKSSRIETRDARRLDRATDAIKTLPNPGEYVHIITGAEFRGWDLVEVLPTLAKAKTYEALTLTTLGFSRTNLEALDKMIQEGKIKPGTLRILASDFFRRSDKDIWQTGAAQAKRLGYGFRSTRNHTKLILAKLAGKYFVVESSANLRSCANIEAFILSQSRKLYEFHTGWIEKVWQISEE